MNWNPISSRTGLLVVLVFSGLGPRPAQGQLVPIRTVPVATGDQFLLDPSDTRGMGGVWIAVEDTLGSVFRNPAATVRLGDGLFFASPVHYGISDDLGFGDRGAGTSLPLGVLLRGERWSGGATLALQELSPGSSSDAFPVPFFDDCLGCRFVTQVPIEPTLSERSARNVYAHAQLARALEGRSGAWGVSVSLADLNWMAGVEHLYAGSRRIDPSGTVLDLRAGLLLETGQGGTLEAIVVHHRVDMRHDVTYLDWIVPPVPPDTVPTPVVVEPRLRVDENRDKTRTWGTQVRYARPLAAEGWRLGWTLTANRNTHPSIPNYEIQNIPRDPGRSWAFDLGAGLSRQAGLVTFGVEAVLEPIWAETWQEALTDTVTTAGQVVRKGDRTIDNDFQFANVLLRSGVGLRWRQADLQLGLEARSIAYDLQQVDRLSAGIRDQSESWMEWAPTWSASWRFGGASVRYFGSATTGTGRPGVAQSWELAGVPRAELDASGAIGILTAPSGPLTLQAATVWTHQVGVVVPIR